MPARGEFIAGNAEYLGLIDKVHPGPGAHPHNRPAVGQDDEQQVVALKNDLT